MVGGRPSSGASLARPGQARAQPRMSSGYADIQPSPAELARIAREQAEARQRALEEERRRQEAIRRAEIERRLAELAEAARRRSDAAGIHLPPALTSAASLSPAMAANPQLEAAERLLQQLEGVGVPMSQRSAQAFRRELETLRRDRDVDGSRAARFVRTLTAVVRESAAMVNASEGLIVELRSLVELTSAGDSDLHRAAVMLQEDASRLREQVGEAVTAHRIAEFRQQTWWLAGELERREVVQASRQLVVWSLAAVLEEMGYDPVQVDTADAALFFRTPDDPPELVRARFRADGQMQMDLVRALWPDGTMEMDRPRLEEKCRRWCDDFAQLTDRLTEQGLSVSSWDTQHRTSFETIEVGSTAPAAGNRRDERRESPHSDRRIERKR